MICEQSVILKTCSELRVLTEKRTDFHQVTQVQTQLVTAQQTCCFQLHLQLLYTM